MTYAWVLIYALGLPYSFTVSGIATQQECQRLGKAVQTDSFMDTRVQCFRYQVAK